MSTVQGNFSIILDQKDYVDSIRSEFLPKEVTKRKVRFADDKERKFFKQGVGQLVWIAGLNKPEGSFMFCSLNTSHANPQMVDLLKYQKAVGDIKLS